MGRIIFHLDLDCFFASVELIDHPQFIGAPVIVGANPKKGKTRGVAQTCNYEARAYGIYSGLPISKCYELCPHGVYLPSRKSRYKEISIDVKKIIKEYSPIFQSGGIDEAYLEMTPITTDFKEAYQIALDIQDKVSKNIGITISIGISYTKSLAKIASDCRKPRGITLITPNNRKKVISHLNITRIPGIGKKTKDDYIERGIKTIGDIFQYNKKIFHKKFGKQGSWAWNVAHGLDDRDLDQNKNRKSIGKERTFNVDVTSFSIIIDKIRGLNNQIHEYLAKYNLSYKTINIKIRYRGFETFNRAFSFTEYLQNRKLAFEKICELYEEFMSSEKPIRLIGIRFTNLKVHTSITQTYLTQFL